MNMTQPQTTQSGGTRTTMTASSCSSLPEFNWLERHPQLRAEILQRQHTDAEGSLQQAQALVELHVFKRMDYRGEGNAFVARLMRKGHTRDQIARAVGQAWLSGNDSFELPRPSRWLGLHTLKFQLLLSLGVTLLVVILVVKWLEHAHPEIEVYLLTIPPLLSVIAFVILALVYWLIKTLVDLSTHKTRQDGA